MKRKHVKKPLEQRRIALQRIKTLFNEARSAFKNEPKLSDRYVELARKIAMKSKVRIPRHLKRQFCKHCHSFLIPSKNCTVRLQKSRVIYTCHNCNKIMRFSYLREQKQRRKKLNS
ncbi:ribonuclease P [Candidatus Woesearchaeota archaeon]|nr:ribonuclease P [Candidatus Woesearchaeota archaeon]